MIRFRLRRPAMMVLAVSGVALAALVCSCARRGMPPGGPVDSEPPRIVSTDPDSGRVAVAGLAEICVTFSEQMDRRTVRDAITLKPQARLGDINWKKNSFCVTLAESLDAATTYAVTLMAGCKDSHGNATKEPYAFVFSTGDSIAPGLISGVVTAKTLPAPGIPVWAFDSTKTPLPDFAKDEPQYVSQAGSNGEFKFLGLPLGTYLLFAFKDKDANRAYDEATDFTSPAQMPVRIVPGGEVATDVKIALVDPTEPGGVRGVVDHCFDPDSVVIAVIVLSVTDSTASFSTSAGKDSTFSVSDVPAGRYSVTCFFDANSDGVRDSAEVECREPHVVQVIAGDVVSGVKLELPCTGPAARPPAQEEPVPGETETSAPGAHEEGVAPGKSDAPPSGSTGMPAEADTTTAE